MHRWSRDRKLIVQLWCEQVLHSERPLSFPAEITNNRSLVYTLLWLQDPSRSTVDCSARRWIDETEVDVSEETLASMQEKCFVVPSLSDKAFESVAVRLKTTATTQQEKERAFLERHTHVVKAVDYSWVSHYTDRQVRRVRGRDITIVGPASTSVTLMYQEIDLDHEVFPHFCCRLEFCFGRRFEVQYRLPILQLGHPHHYTDEPPTINDDSLQRIRDHLGLSSTFPLGSLWNVLVRRIPFDGHIRHAEGMKARYGFTLGEAVQRVITERE